MEENKILSTATVTPELKGQETKKEKKNENIFQDPLKDLFKAYPEKEVIQMLLDKPKELAAYFQLLEKNSRRLTKIKMRQAKSPHLVISDPPTRILKSKNGRSYVKKWAKVHEKAIASWEVVQCKLAQHKLLLWVAVMVSIVVLLLSLRGLYFSGNVFRGDFRFGPSAAMETPADKK